MQGTDIYGDIKNFAESAKVGLILLYFASCPNVYGELTDVLDAMKTREDVKGQTYGWGFYNSKVTYKGKLINQSGARTIVFDNEGNYTVDGE